MTSIIKVHVLSGAYDETPPCYLLQVDEFRFLLDCGWDEHFNMDFIKEVKKYIKQIDAVLLSYPDGQHLGALPYLVGKCGLSCPVYATTPVYKMGQMFMYDLYLSHSNSEDFNIFTLDDVDAAFDKIQQVKYSQNVSMKGKGHGLTITPLPAGHMLGGTIWKIVKDGEEDIVYAIDYNHKKERHLNGCVLDSVSKPHLLITDAYNAAYEHDRRRKRDEQLLTHIVNTVRSDGNVLVAVDTAGRVLELVHLLDQLWQAAESGLTVYSLIFLNNVTYNVVEFAKSQVEWMSDKVLSSLESQRANPFHFKHVQLCHSMSEVNKLPSPKVVLSSVPDLNCGFSRDLFVDWCENSKNTVILTNRTQPKTLARQLIDEPSIPTVTVEVKKRVKLEGVELEKYREDKRKKEEEEEQEKAADRGSGDESDSDNDENDEVMISPGIDRMDVDLIGHAKRNRSVSESRSHSAPGTGGKSKKSHLLFPCPEVRIRCDDYGELIKLEDYMKDPAEEAGGGVGSVPGTSDGDIKSLTQYQEPIEIPTKCVSSLKTLDIKAKIVFIDFEGRSDGESMKKLVVGCKPKQLILVHGSTAATQHMRDHCQKAGVTKVFAPRALEVVDVTTESHIYQVKLTDLLVTSLRFLPVKDAQITWLDGIIDLHHKITDTENKMITDENADDFAKEEKSAVDATPNIEPLAPSQIPYHKSVFINDPRLSDIKKILIENGLQAEFIHGNLVCNDQVSIKKVEHGKTLQVEGAVSATYYKVRQLLYQQYAII